MATDIISTLFGLPSLDGRELEEQSRTRDYTTGAQFGAAFINPYGDPNVANLEQKQFASQFALGGAVARGVGGLFGMKTQDQRRAADIQGVLKSTQEEVGTQDPAVLYPAMSKKLADMGYGEEAFRVGQQGQAARMEQGKAVGDMAYKKAMIDYYQLLGANQKAAEESKLMEQRGQIANGALTQIEGTTDPVIADKVWNATLIGLKAKGLDISSLADLPPTERAKALQGIVDSSENSATRTKAEIAAATLSMKEEQWKDKVAMTETKNSLLAAIANLRAEVQREGISAANQRAIDNRIAALETKKDVLDIQFANKVNADAAAKTASPEFNKQLKGFLQEGLGLEDKKVINAATTDFNVLYTDFLGQRDHTGMPLYQPESALAKAKQVIQQRVGKKPTLGGYGRDKATYDTKKEIDFSDLK